MREKLEKEIGEMINYAIERRVYDRNIHCIGSTTYFRIIELILEHLELEPDIKCRYPKTILKSIKEKK